MANANNGASITEPCTHEMNGSRVRSMAPTAPRSEITQNQSAAARTTAKPRTVDQGMDDGVELAVVLAALGADGSVTG